MKIAKGPRRLILAVFATSILTTLASVAHAKYEYVCDMFQQALTLHLEASMQFFPRYTHVTRNLSF